MHRAQPPRLPQVLRVKTRRISKVAARRHEEVRVQAQATAVQEQQERLR